MFPGVDLEAAPPAARLVRGRMLPDTLPRLPTPHRLGRWGRGGLMRLPRIRLKFSITIGDDNADEQEDRYVDAMGTHHDAGRHTGFTTPGTTSLEDEG